jgi:amino acid transporter
VGEVAGRVGGAVWTSFLLAGVLAAFTAVAYAELVTKYPQAAGAALYTHKASASRSCSTAGATRAARSSSNPARPCRWRCCPAPRWRSTR